MSVNDYERFQNELIKCIDNRFELFRSTLKYNTTLYGKVISYANNIAKVKVNDIEYNCFCNLSVTSDNSVRVIAPNNDYSKLYVDAIL